MSLDRFVEGYVEKQQDAAKKETVEEMRKRIEKDPVLKPFLEFKASCSNLKTPECRAVWTDKGEFMQHYLKYHHIDYRKEGYKPQTPFYAKCPCPLEFDDREKWLLHMGAVHKK